MNEQPTAVPPVSPAPLPALSYSSPFGAADSPIWYDGKYIITFDQTLFPARCLKCNGGDNLRPVQRILTWVPPWMYLFLIFPGILIGAIILLIAQKKATVTVNICKGCRNKRIKRILIAWGIFFGSVLSFVLAGYLENGYLVFLGIIIFFACLFYIVLAIPYCTAAKIKDKVVKIRGAGKPFLNSLDRK